jgi:DNA-directed RNA polymerase specialized sigma24 family protein
VTEADRIAFERFVAEHGDRLLHTAYGLCGDWQHAEDLVQQTLTAVARRWGAIESNPLGYAYRCVVRSNIDRWRALSRRREVLLDPHDIAAAVPPTTPPAMVSAARARSRMRACSNRSGSGTGNRRAATVLRGCTPSCVEPAIVTAASGSPG